MADTRTPGDDVGALIERIVREARIANARDRAARSDRAFLQAVGGDV